VPVSADQTNPLPGIHHKTHIVKNHLTAVCLFQTADFRH